MLKRMRNRAKETSTEELSITSLIDILTTILIFLIATNSFTSQVVNILPDITLPISDSITPNDNGIVIQVSQKELWLDEEKILNFDPSNSLTSISFDQNGRRIVPLYNALVAKRDEIKSLHKEVPASQDFSGSANLMVDEHIKYDLLKKVMFTAAEAGFVEYKFIVMGKE